MVLYGDLRIITPPSLRELPPISARSLLTTVPGPSPPPRFRGFRPKKPPKSIEHPYAFIRGEKIAREARQQYIQNAGNAHPPPSGPLGAPRGAPGGRFINTRAFINRRSLVQCCGVAPRLRLGRTRVHFGATVMVPPPELLAKSHVCGPELEPRPDFCSKKCGESESGLRFPPCEMRHFRFFASHGCCWGSFCNGVILYRVAVLHNGPIVRLRHPAQCRGSEPWLLASARHARLRCFHTDLPSEFTIAAAQEVVVCIARGSDWHSLRRAGYSGCRGAL
jgi:hypothetical protein